MSLELPGPTGYCSSQLIPYLGNKRALLPRLLPVLQSLTDGMRSPLFLDPFAGSGAVSRLARAIGMRVIANDWEPYSEALNACWLSLRPSDLDRSFGGRVGQVLAQWNGMHPAAAGVPYGGSAAGSAGWSAGHQPYMARWYAPEHTEAPRLGHERLFYTAENARFLDMVRYRLDDEYPASEPGSDGDIRRRVIMGALLLEASVHANTSGVFKAYHRGFGGHGGDALHRILGSMELEVPILPELEPAVVMRDDAAAFVGKHSADVVYCDPPYNQHQYGSNYHILNTLLRWDGVPHPMDGSACDGASRIAGIPQDWKRTRSDFCSRHKAAGAIAGLLEACDAAHLVFSWNADAHLSGDELIELLAPRGRLAVVALEYVAYRGGRQSASRSGSSREYLFTVDTRRPPIGTGAIKQKLHGLAMVDDAMRASYRADRETAEPEIRAFLDQTMRHPGANARRVLSDMDPERRLDFLKRLSTYSCPDVPSELDAVQQLSMQALGSGDVATARKVASEAPRLIRKLAHQKYALAFDRYRSIFERIGNEAEDQKLLSQLAQLDRLKELRAGVK